jgi:hypothetical protein
MSVRRTAALLASGLLASCLAAQTAPAPFRFAPDDCQLVLRIAGPAAWAKEFAATGIGKLLAGKALAPAWAKFEEALPPMLEEVSFADDLRALGEALPAYGGELTVAARLDLDDLQPAAAGKRAPRFDVAFALSADEHTDLSALGTKIEKLFGDDEQPRTVKTDTAALRVRSFGGVQVSLPQIIDGELVVLLGTDLERTAGHFLAVPADHRFKPAEELRTGTFGLQFEAEPLVGPVFRAFAAQETKRSRLDGAKLLSAVGLDGIRRLAIGARADGEHVVQSMTVEFVDRPGGVFAVALPPRRAATPALQFLPDTATTFNSGAFDPDAIWPLVTAIFAAAGEDLGTTQEAFEKQAAEFLGVRLHEDLIAHLGDGWLRIDDLAAKPEEIDDAALDKLDTRFGDSCYVVTLRDGKAFADAVEKALRKRGLHAARKTEEYAGVKVHRMNLLGSYPIEYAITDELLVVGIGARDGTQRNLRGVLDRASAAAAGKPARELPAPVQARLQLLPPDWCGISVTSLLDILDAFHSAATMAGTIAQPDDADADDDEEAAARQALEAFVALVSACRTEFARLQVDAMVGAQWQLKDRTVVRWLW